MVFYPQQLQLRDNEEFYRSVRKPQWAQEITIRRPSFVSPERPLLCPLFKNALSYSVLSSIPSVCVTDFLYALFRSLSIRFTYPFFPLSGLRTCTLPWPILPRTSTPASLRCERKSFDFMHPGLLIASLIFSESILEDCCLSLTIIKSTKNNLMSGIYAFPAD